MNSSQINRRIETSLAMKIVSLELLKTTSPELYARTSAHFTADIDALAQELCATEAYGNVVFDGVWAERVLSQ